jgi:hypothetical protein
MFSGRTPPSRHRCCQFTRCPRRMVPATRHAGVVDVEARIAHSHSDLKYPPKRHPVCPPSALKPRCRSRCIDPGARNGIFATRDQALKSARPRRQRPNTGNRASQKARECGSFSQSLRDRQIRRTAWWTNQGQTGHWEIIVSMAFSKLSRLIQKPASAAVGENLTRSARSRRR